ncbi:single-stranded DNA-binding protein [Patescibacteria group bacterium]|nr:single-stranded DNA-binding protein [Patescibacteria group bacterium]MBU1673098.1 single-stranded DNA-binding protein [Patescibacteria group bacterium]MBU1963379.1 single-stranded DNA-binding protein [Patescibacteria group bacterium]
MDLNKVTLIGNLTRDPEIKEINGSKLAQFGLATNYSWKDKKTGDKKEDVVFHNVSAWNGLGEVAEKWLKKGNKVYIEGRVNNRTYEKDGVKKNYSEVVAKNMIMLSGKATKTEKSAKEAEVVEEEVDATKVPF